MAANELKHFRAEKDRVFATDPHSPLTPEQRRSFHGLNYFEENPALVIRASVDRNVDPEEVPMATSSGDEQIYRRYGVVRFKVDDEPAEVFLYASEDSDELFVPFRDATSGHETYGAGRYLELHTHGDDLTIDFNYAYNPNCAYDEAWSCPLPPRENWLKVPIRAGEKAFKAGH
ncbi:MAG TPA: DUF1684 domain-containing protein [Candidatus Dormibacteraeota bacterium]|nr:DUF1684 domain-containing protein [Candidatus Dormibacteraeota bacterium]